VTSVYRSNIGIIVRWMAVALVFISLFISWYWIDFGGYIRLSKGPFHSSITTTIPEFYTITTSVEELSFTRINILLLIGLILGGYAAYFASGVAAAFSGLSLILGLSIFIDEFRKTISSIVGVFTKLLGAYNIPQTNALWGSLQIQVPFYGIIEISWTLGVGFYLTLAASILMIISLFSR